jgi:hypothetical protein
MPRNPNATRCAVPNCKSWAMRGQARCRAHRDAELGPRGAGAPSGNLNALSHGAYSRPLLLAELEDLARGVADPSGDLFGLLGRLLGYLYSRVHDPLLTLVALRACLPALIDAAASRLFEAELDAFLAPLPPEPRAIFRAFIVRFAPPKPEDRLHFLRQLVCDRTRRRQGDSTLERGP